MIDCLMDRFSWFRLGRILLLLALLLSITLADILPAQAAIRSFEEAPGQILTQSRTTLQDQSGNRWQAITFKRTKPDGSPFVALRLVGFPGAVAIDRSQPLVLMDSLGHTTTAEEASAPIFTDNDNPEPHIGQYNLLPVLDSLRPELPLELMLPVVDGEPVVLQIAPQTIREWQRVAG